MNSASRSSLLCQVRHWRHCHWKYHSQDLMKIFHHYKKYFNYMDKTSKMFSHVLWLESIVCHTPINRLSKLEPIANSNSNLTTCLLQPSLNSNRCLNSYKDIYVYRENLLCVGSSMQLLTPVYRTTTPVVSFPYIESRLWVDQYGI